MNVVLTRDPYIFRWARWCYDGLTSDWISLEKESGKTILPPSPSSPGASHLLHWDIYPDLPSLPPATCPLSIDLTQNCGGAKITFGIVHQICFCCSNLIFWIVMRCGIANVGWRVENWWTTPLSGADVLPDSLNNRGSWSQSGQVRIVNNHVEIVDAWKLHLNCADLEGILWLFSFF